MGHTKRSVIRKLQEIFKGAGVEYIRWYILLRVPAKSICTSEEYYIIGVRIRNIRIYVCTVVYNTFSSSTTRISGIS